MSGTLQRLLGWIGLPVGVVALGLGTVGCAADGGDVPAGDGADDPLPPGCSSWQSPQVIGKVEGSDVSEVSGALLSRRFAGVLWLHNDGDRAVLHARGDRGENIADITIPGVALVDWEDIGFGPGPDPARDYLYLGDIGDNTRDRETIQIVRFPEPDPRVDRAASDIEAFELGYSDGKSHDAEAMFVDPVSRRVFVVTKRQKGDKQARLFATPGRVEDSEGVLERVLDEDDARDLDASWVAADISARGDRIVLVDRDGQNRIFRRSSGQSVEAAMAKRACPAPRLKGQQEAIALSPDGDAYYMIPEGDLPPVQLAVRRPTCARWSEPRALGQVQSPFAQEISGIAASRTEVDLLWAVNDPGGPERNLLLAFDHDGTSRGVFAPEGAINQDWEDLALGPGPVPDRDHLYIADIGDNDLSRATIRVYRVAEPSVAGADPDSITDLDGVDELTFRYDDGRAHDAESLMIDPVTGDLYVVTRSRPADPDTLVFAARAPLSPGSAPTTLDLVARLPAADLAGTVTSADISSDGIQIALRMRGGENRIYPIASGSPLGAMPRFEACIAPGADGKHDALAFSPDADRLYMIPEVAAPSILVVDRR